MIRSFRSKPLQAFWQDNDRSGVNPIWVKRVTMLLSLLDACRRPEEMNLPGMRLHRLKGNRSDYSVNLTGNWRITFHWEGEGATDVNMEDTHD